MATIFLCLKNKNLIALLFLLASSFVGAQSDKSAQNIQVAVFGGGCFWCMEKPFDELDSVLKTESGYTGGKIPNPTYEQVSDGRTGHYEAVRVTYDANKTSYEKLLDVFWRNIDPFDAKGQFCDKGEQYEGAIFTATPDEEKSARDSLIRLTEKIGGKIAIATKILPLKTFYLAEGYHQDYYLKNPLRYKYYRLQCGRDQRLKEIADVLNSR